MTQTTPKSTTRKTRSPAKRAARAGDQGLEAIKLSAETKIGGVIRLLRQKGGVSLDELVALTGWQPHTTRAALTGLRKKSHAIAKVKLNGVTRYSIAPAAAEA